MRKNFQVINGKGIFRSNSPKEQKIVPTAVSVCEYQIVRLMASVKMAVQKCLGVLGGVLGSRPKTKNPEAREMIGVCFGVANRVSGFVAKSFHIHRLFSKEVAITDCTLQEVCQHRQFLITFGIALKR